MMAIILGLYLFLWGSKKERKIETSLPKSVNRSEVKLNKNNELLCAQLTATVVPTASPLSHGSDND